MPATGASLNLDVDKPALNVLAGARYLRLLLDRYARTDLALAAYNVGPTTVDKANGVLGPVGMHYVLDVENRWSALAGCSSNVLRTFATEVPAARERPSRAEPAGASSARDRPRCLVLRARSRLRRRIGLVRRQAAQLRGSTADSGRTLMIGVVPVVVASGSRARSSRRCSSPCAWRRRAR